jgi:uncharacterized protein
MIADQIRTDIITSMKSGAALRLSVLRMISSEINYKKIEVQRELTDEDTLSVLQKEAKKRREAIDSYEKANRSEAAAKEKEELEIIQNYLPTLLSEEEIRSQISNIKELEGLTEFGQVMRIVSPMFKGKADGSMVARIVKEKLAA